MMTDFEDQLRQRLHAHAEQVTPNPETWARVQEGIRRERRFRWVYAGAGATALAALAAVAVLALPGLLSGTSVELQPGPGVATQPQDPDAIAIEPPDGSADAAPFAAPADLVLATPDGVALVGPGGVGTLGDAGDFPAETVAVRPGSSLDDLEVVAADGCSLRRYRREPSGVASHDVATADPGACALGPRFSPDGEHLAWIEEGGGSITLATVGWSDDGEERVRNARFELDLTAIFGNVQEFGEIRVTEWVWREVDGASASGFVTLAAAPRGDGGENRLMTLEIERQGDGALALPAGDAPSLFDDGDRRFVAYQQTATATWTLEIRGDGETVLTRSDEGAEIHELVGLGYPGFGSAGPVWLEVAGETAIVGDGSGGVWTVPFDDGFGDAAPFPTEAEEIGVLDVRHVAVIGDESPAPAQPVTPSDPARPEEDAVVDGDAGDGEAEAAEPTTVAQMVAAIRAAAEAGDLEALAALADPDEFTFTYAAEIEPVEFWEGEMAQGTDVLGLLLAILDLPSAEIPSEGGPTITAWPWVHSGVPFESLSSAELVMLEEAVGSDVVETYEQAQDYLGPRLGIRADGSWIYFIVGGD